MAAAKGKMSEEHKKKVTDLAKSNKLETKFKAFCGDGKFVGSNAQKIVNQCWKDDADFTKMKKLSFKAIQDTVHAKVKADHKQLNVSVDLCVLYIHFMATEIARCALGLKMSDMVPEDEVFKYAQMLSQKVKDAPVVKATQQSKTGNVGGLTDASKFTGAHKERFGADGKGKGIEGREDRADNSGYVGNYKGADTYDKKK